MAQYNCYFKMEDGQVFPYNVSARNLEEAEDFGRSLESTVSPKRQFLYARTPNSLPIETGQRYVFSVRHNTAQLNYRKVSEEAFAPFDYSRPSNVNADWIALPCQTKAKLLLGGQEVDVPVTLKLRGFRTHKFADMTKQYVFEVAEHDGALALLGYDSEYATSPSVAIPLEIQSQ